LRTDRAAAREDAEIAAQLANLLAANRFISWLTMAALDALLVDASANLMQLSDGQFELAHDGGALQVIDHADADTRRVVKTLSGGETFQASLSLALALSSQLAARSMGNANRLDSIFLDEGFGTLDEQTLDAVAGTLENLAHRNRMVGVITHVPALADRIPVRYRVTRNSRTSTVVREDL
jgi:exonuclease SbcC